MIRENTVAAYGEKGASMESLKNGGRIPTPRELTDAGICPTCYNRQNGGVLYGDDQKTLIYRDSLIECFFVDKPRAPGHVAILSVAHYQDMSEAPDDLNAYMMRVSAALGRILPRVFGCVRCYLVSMCDGPSNHYHLQLIPRYPHEERGSDNLVKPRGRYVYDGEKLRAVSELLRRELLG